MISLGEVLRGGVVYAPDCLGKADLLISGGRILRIGNDLSEYAALPHIRMRDLNGCIVAPGIIDAHEHLIGGGGESGFTSRVPEAQLSDLTTSGVTTVIGMLGTDSVTRSLEALYAKTKALTAEGIDAYMLTGAYAYPSPTLTGSVTRDIMLTDRVLGVKLAISDHRDCVMSEAEFFRVCAEARRGGMLSGKAGVAVIHVGGGEEGLALLEAARQKTALPVKTFLPTHVGRSASLIAQAAAWNKSGGFIDFTAAMPHEGAAAEQILQTQALGASIERITLTSDAFGSAPVFNVAGDCTGLTYSRPNSLLSELRFLLESGLPMERALLPLTANPARVFGLAPQKGRIAEGACADLMVLDGQCRLVALAARGQWLVEDGAATVSGAFEQQPEKR